MELSQHNKNLRMTHCAEEGLIDELEALIHNGAEANFNDSCALKKAANNGHTKVVPILLKNGADVHSQNDCALGWAAENGHTDTVKILLENGASIHANSEYALKWAAHGGHTDTVKLLFEYGADAKVETPLMWAAEKGHTEVVKVLLEHGADIHANDDYVIKWATNQNTINLMIAEANMKIKPETLQWLKNNDCRDALKAINTRELSEKMKNTLKPKIESKSRTMKI